MFSMLVNTLGEIGCYTDIQRSVSLAGEYVNGRLHHVSAKKNFNPSFPRRRESRNLKLRESLNISERLRPGFPPRNDGLRFL